MDLIHRSLLFVLLSVPLGVQAQDLDWLTGCWESYENYKKEVWVRNPDGTLLGFSASVNNADITFYELLYIREVGGVLTYTAHPSGQHSATFVLRDEGSDDGGDNPTLVFESPSHDYPQRITYRLEDDRLVATISDMAGGRLLSFSHERCR